MSKDLSNKPPENNLTPQADNSLVPVEGESFLRFKGRRAVIGTGVVSIAAWFSTFLNWGTRIIDWLDRADFISTTFIDLLRWLFSPSGAHVLTGVFLIAFFIAVYRTLFSGERPQQRLQHKPQAELQNQSATVITESEDKKKIEALNAQIDNLESKHSREIYGRDKRFDSLEGEIRRLKDEVQTQEIRADLSKQELENFSWLHEIAAAQARDIDKYVIVERVLLCDLRLIDPIQIPYVEFWLEVYNMSVYDITIHKDTIEGQIKFRLNNLLEGKEIIYLEDSIPPSSRVNVNIRQRLKPSEVNLLAPYENKRDEALPLFNLDDLGIAISGGTQFPQVERKHLTIPRITWSQDTAQLIAEPNIKIEILEALYRGFVSQNEGILAMTINANQE